MHSTLRKASVLLAAAFAAAPAAYAQAVDECGPTSPLLSLSTPITGTTEFATPSSTLSANICGRYESSGGYQDVFARFIPTTTGTYRLTTCPSPNTVLSIHSGCPANDANSIVCGDDDEDCSEYSSSTITAALVAGVEYHVRIATPLDAQPGPFSLSVTSLPPVANDECANATPVAVGGSINGTNVNASGGDMTLPNCQLNNNGDGADVWYSVNVTTGGLYSIEAATPGFEDLVITLFAVCGGGPVACSDYDWVSNSTRIHWNLQPGTHLIRVAGSRGNTGRPEESSFTLSVSNPVPAATNDTCATAATLAPGGSVNSSTTGSSSETGFVSVCHWLDHRDVWYSFSSPETKEFEFTLSNTTFNAGMTILGGCDFNAPTNPSPQLACGGSSLRFIAVAGTTYFVRVAGDGDAVGDFTLSVDAGTPIPTNDECGAPSVANLGTTAGTTAGASGLDLTPNAGYEDTRDVWFSFTAPAAGYYVFDTTGSSLEDTVLALFDTCGGDFVVVNDDISGRGDNQDKFSKLGRTLTAGQQVLVRVAGTAGSFGLVSLNIATGAAPTAPSNDTWDNAKPITTYSFTEDIDARAATSDIGSACVLNDLPTTQYGVWYRFTAPERGVFTFTEEGRNARAVTSYFTQDSPPILDLPLQCDTVRFEMQEGESHLLLVGSQGVEYPAFPFRVIASFRPEVGCCTRPTGCTYQPKTACIGAGAVWTSGLCGPGTTVQSTDTFPISIPNPPSNNNPTYVNSTINYTTAGIISNVLVTANIKHNSADHVVLRLITPWGSTIQLLNGVDAVSAFDGTYTFSDTGLQTLLEVGEHNYPLPERTYPANVVIEPNVRGRSAQGVWTLAIGDDRRNVNGQLLGWSLTVHGMCTSTCRVDFDTSGVVTIDDIFIFLNAWFAADPRTDHDQSGVITIDDIFIFLNDWFRGCP